MTNHRLGVLAFALLGVYWLVEAARDAASYPAWTPVTGEPGLMTGALVVCFATGIGLLRWRVALSTWLFGGGEEWQDAEVDDTDEDRVDPSLLDAQIVGLALLGVWQVAAGLPELLRLVWPTGGFDRFAARSPVMWLEALLPIAIGAFLIFRGEIVARLWAPRLRASVSP